jgi:hypothetical protein
MMKARGLQLPHFVDEVLHYLWDPIGVAGAPETRDEYQGYVGPVLAMLQSGASESELSTYLSRVADEDMGLASERALADQAASALIKWQRFFEGQERANDPG